METIRVNFFPPDCMESMSLFHRSVSYYILPFFPQVCYGNQIKAVLQNYVQLIRLSEIYCALINSLSVKVSCGQRLNTPEEKIGSKNQYSLSFITVFAVYQLLQERYEAPSAKKIYVGRLVAYCACCCVMLCCGIFRVLLLEAAACFSWKMGTVHT